MRRRRLPHRSARSETADVTTAAPAKATVKRRPISEAETPQPAR